MSFSAKYGMSIFRKAVAALLAALCFLITSSCRIQDKEYPQKVKTDHLQEQEGKEPTNLIYYTIGKPDPALQQVTEHINEVLKKKIGVTISYNKVDWQEYDKKLDALISSATPFDVAFASNYSQNAKKGAWLCLDPYLKTVGKSMYDTVNPILWRGVTMPDGKIYGVPTNKEVAVPELWMYPESLIKKYDIDITKYKTIESLDPIFEMIHTKEPSYQVMQIAKDTNNPFLQYGYEYCVDKMIPLVVKSMDKRPKVQNVFEQPEIQRLLYVLRKYYLKGYISPDAAISSTPDIESGYRVFWREASGGPCSDVQWSHMRGYKLVTYQASPIVVTTESTRGGVMSVSSGTKHPEACVEFLNLLNTNPEVRNLFNYGIQGVQYDLDSKGQVVCHYPETYAGVQYTQGNWFILKTLGGHNPDPINKWELFKKFNEKAVISQVLGFTPNLKGVEVEADRVKTVWNKYYPCLITGSVDVHEILPMFLKELKLAGIDKIQATLQQQVNDFIAAKQ